MGPAANFSKINAAKSKNCAQNVSDFGAFQPSGFWIRETQLVIV
jgi:hypothetical protein